jgi:hypothetical protein
MRVQPLCSTAYVMMMLAATTHSKACGCSAHNIQHTTFSTQHSAACAHLELVVIRPQLSNWAELAAIPEAACDD